MTTAYTEPPFKAEKLRDMLRYFIGHGQSDDTVGKTKLMKLLYYSDFLHYRDRGEAISWAHYRKLPLGPVPREANALLSDLEPSDWTSRAEARGPR